MKYQIRSNFFVLTSLKYYPKIILRRTYVIAELCTKGDVLNQINPKKLLNSKWTAVQPKNKEKHFIVTELEFDDDKNVVSCEIEAVITKRLISIEWQELKDINNWVCGWK